MDILLDPNFPKAAVPLTMTVWAQVRLNTLRFLADRSKVTCSISVKPENWFLPKATSYLDESDILVPTNLGLFCIPKPRPQLPGSSSLPLSAVLAPGRQF